MISAKFLWGNVLFGGKLQIGAKKIKFWNLWKRPQYEIGEYALIYPIILAIKEKSWKHNLLLGPFELGAI